MTSITPFPERTAPRPMNWPGLRMIHANYLLMRIHLRIAFGRGLHGSRRRLLALGINFYPAVKRLMDMSGAGLLLLALSPLLIATALIIRWTSPGPVFYSQERCGRHGKRFHMFKFRSMYRDADRRKAELMADNEAGAVLFKMKRDPRITPIGRVIRKLSIDELPQLWNILRGEMSLVGPRPPVPGEVAEYAVTDRWRLDMTPGLTCYWQVSGRSDLSFEQQVRLDRRYYFERGLATDFVLLLRTVPAVLSGKGAY